MTGTNTHSYKAPCSHTCRYADYTFEQSCILHNLCLNALHRGVVKFIPMLNTYHHGNGEEHRANVGSIGEQSEGGEIGEENKNGQDDGIDLP